MICLAYVGYIHNCQSFMQLSNPNLVLVVSVAVTEVSYQSDEVSLEADDRGMGRNVSVSTEG